MGSGTVTPFEWFYRHTNFVGEVSLHFLLKPNAMGNLNVHTDKKYTEVSSGELGGVPRKSGVC